MDVETQKAVARFELITSATETWEQNMERPGVTADLRAVLAALAKLQAERDEALRQMAVYAREAGLATGKLETSEAAGIVEGWKERAEKAEAERDEAREALRPTDYNTLGQIGKAALDVCLPILKAHWAGGGSASMNPSLEYLDVSMGKAAMEAASRALGGGE